MYSPHENVRDRTSIRTNARALVRSCGCVFRASSRICAFQRTRLYVVESTAFFPYTRNYDLPTYRLYFDICNKKKSFFFNKMTLRRWMLLVKFRGIYASSTVMKMTTTMTAAASATAIRNAHRTALTKYIYRQMRN